MKIKQLILLISIITISLLSSLKVQATVVRVETNEGNFDINLYDNGTPNTVSNFLAYVNNGDYSNVIFHRSVNNFIIQSGGFAYNGDWPAQAIFANPSIINEPVYSNVRGTIAMAKLSGNANSATNQWFINLTNNSANLDNQNGGFTAFGEVTTAGMVVVDQIALVPQYNLGGAFAEIPLNNYDGTSDPNDNNLIYIYSIDVIDSTVDSASGLNPPLNSSQINPGNTLNTGGGGTMGLFILGLLVLFSRYNYRKSL